MLVLAGSIFDLRCSTRNLYLWSVESVAIPCESSLVVACELFGCSMWDIVPWLGLEPRSSPLGVWSLSHWTIKEVPTITDINHNIGHDGLPSMGLYRVGHDWSNLAAAVQEFSHSRQDEPRQSSLYTQGAEGQCHSHGYKKWSLRALRRQELRGAESGT